MSKNRSLHGLRGLACLLVFCSHVWAGALTGGICREAAAIRAAFEPNLVGQGGVALFFMISGYLITASLTRHRSVKTFLVNRAIRIYPAFLLPHLLIFTFGPIIGYRWLGEVDVAGWLVHFVSNLLFLPGVFSLPLAQIVAWSLSFEFVFYLLAAAAFAIVNANAWRAARVIAGAAWMAVTALFLSKHPMAWFFVAGVGVYFAGPSLRDIPWVSARWSPVGLAATVALCLLFEAAFPAALACGTLTFVAVVRETGLLARLLQMNWLQYLGTISYSLYLWHVFFLFALKRIYWAFGGVGSSEAVNFAVFAALSLAGSLVTAHLSYHFIEDRLTSRLFRRDKPMQPVPVPMPLPARSAA